VTVITDAREQTQSDWSAASTEGPSMPITNEQQDWLHAVLGSIVDVGKAIVQEYQADTIY
jgi:hypothetical protein